jgi:hypothetical protein
VLSPGANVDPLLTCPGALFDTSPPLPPPHKHSAAAHGGAVVAADRFPRRRARRPAHAHRGAWPQVAGDEARAAAGTCTCRPATRTPPETFSFLGGESCLQARAVAAQHSAASRPSAVPSVGESGRGQSDASPRGNRPSPPRCICERRQAGERGIGSTHQSIPYHVKLNVDPLGGARVSGRVKAPFFLSPAVPQLPLLGCDRYPPQHTRRMAIAVHYTV